MGEIILLGLLVGIVFYELTGISPGGLVVPGIIAYYIYTPSRIAMTLVISVIAYLIVRLIANQFIIYGKRKFVVHIIIATIISFLFQLLGEGLDLAFLTIPIIGYIIPGIISNEMNKQGLPKTLLALVIVSGIISLLVLLI